MTEGKKSLRVYFVTHHDGHQTGYLMRTWRKFFDDFPPAAYGRDEQEVYDKLQLELLDRLATGKEQIEQYLWEETFHTRRVDVKVHPQTLVKKRP